ncbi:MAG: hypothetical protein DCC55_23950 [Chloroflexi bacterium]|nr:MAG: hypothetical protein DCC55_23950 [Chloroflexota bacterium]
MKSALAIRPLVVCFIAFGLWALASRTANAAEISYCAAFPPSPTNDCRSGPVTPTNWSGTLALPQFDPALGELNAVRIAVEGFVQGDVQYENTGPNAALISATHSVTIHVTLPNNLAVESIPSTTRVELVPPFDNVLDFDGLSGRTFSISNTKEISLTLTGAVDMAPFIGTGNVSIPALASGISFIRGPGNLSALLRAQAASVVVSITYFFSTPGIDIEKFTNGRDADGPNDGDVPQIPPGDTVVWTYRVRNTGTVPFTLAEVVVTDDQPGVTPQFVPASDVGADGILDPGEVWLYVATLPAQNLSNATGGTTIVPGCDPSGTGLTRNTYRNIGAVTVNNLTDTDPSHYCNPAPGIEIKKFTNNADADNPNDPDVPLIAPGATVTWTYVVTNTGTVSYPVASVVVTDSQPGVTPVLVDDGDGDAFLAPGEVWRYQVVGVAQNLLSTAIGTVTVPGCDPSGTGLARATYRNVGTVIVNTLTDFDPSHYCNPPAPGIEIVKLVNNADANDPNAPDVPQLVPGETVNWLYRVTNTGNLPFLRASVVVTDSQPGVTPLFDPLSDAGGDEILSPGETWFYRASAVAQELRTPEPGTVVVDGCNPGGLAVPGERETYRNMGQVTVPGAEDEDPAHYCNPPGPNIVIKKFVNNADADNPNDVDVPELNPGAVVTWTYLVTNTGNLAFNRSDVVVTDSHPAVTPIFDPASDDGDEILSPGETWRYFATTQVEDLDNPSPNTTVINGCDPLGFGFPVLRNTYRNIGRVVIPGAEDEDPAHYCNPPEAGVVPGITIKKFTNGADADDPNGADVPVIEDGRPVTWTFIITNTGTITFPRAQITVTDSYTTVAPLFDPASDDGDDLLAPGESWRYFAMSTAVNLETTAGVIIVDGCRDEANVTRSTYFNLATVRVLDLVATDPSHYCNPRPSSLDESEEPAVGQSTRLLLPFVQQHR